MSSGVLGGIEAEQFDRRIISESCKQPVPYSIFYFNSNVYS